MYVAIFLVAALGFFALLVGGAIFLALRTRRERLDTLTPLTFAEVSFALKKEGLSLLDKRALLARFNDQRVRWAATFDHVSQPRYGQCLLHADGARPGLGGNIFFCEFSGRDLKRLEAMKQGTHVVVEGSLSIDEKWLNIQLLRGVLREGSH